MSRACLFATVAAGVVLLNVCQAALVAKNPANPATNPQGYCVKCTQVCSNVTLEGMKGEWYLLYSTEVKYRRGTSYWGGDFPYDFCDPLNLNSGCMGTGFCLPAMSGVKDFGYTYSFNAFTEVWTIEQFSVSTITVPGTSYVGFRVNYNHYIQVEEKSIFNNQTVTACGNKVIRSGPIYRSTNFIVLAAANDFSWVAVLYCDSFYGFVDNSPVIHILVKKDQMSKVSYPFNTLYFYEEIRTAILKNNLNIYGADFNLVYHDQDGLYPTSVAWESVQWEADCMCTSGSSVTVATQ